MKNLTQDSWCPGGGSNRSLPEHESRAIPLNQTCSVGKNNKKGQRKRRRERKQRNKETRTMLHSRLSQRGLWRVSAFWYIASRSAVKATDVSKEHVACISKSKLRRSNKPAWSRQHSLARPTPRPGRCHVLGLAWRIIMGSGSDESIYWILTSRNHT
jgi:hypothetical protein